MRKIQFLADHYYHVYNRGTEQRQIFLDPADYRKFTTAMGEYRPDLVAIVAYVLMPNHFHCLLRQLTPDGVSRYMHRLGTGFTMYFNARYERTGGLFQGTFKAVAVESTEQLWHLTRYIHGNPVKGALQQPLEVKMQQLERYPWSSYQDYVRGQTSGLVELDDFQSKFLDVLPEESSRVGAVSSAGGFVEQYRKFMYEWLAAGVTVTEAKPRPEA